MNGERPSIHPSCAEANARSGSDSRLEGHGLVLVASASNLHPSGDGTRTVSATWIRRGSNQRDRSRASSATNSIWPSRSTSLKTPPRRIASGWMRGRPARSAIEMTSQEPWSTALSCTRSTRSGSPFRSMSPPRPIRFAVVESRKPSRADQPFQSRSTSFVSFLTWMRCRNDASSPCSEIRWTTSRPPGSGWTSTRVHVARRRLDVLRAPPEPTARTEGTRTRTSPTIARRGRRRGARNRRSSVEWNPQAGQVRASVPERSWSHTGHHRSRPSRLPRQASSATNAPIRARIT